MDGIKKRCKHGRHALQKHHHHDLPVVVMHGRRVERSSSDHDQHRHLKENHNCRNRNSIWVLLVENKIDKAKVRSIASHFGINEEGARDQDTEIGADQNVFSSFENPLFSPEDRSQGLGGEA